MIDWNALIQSTPATLRAGAIVVLLGLFSVAIVVLSVAVWKGRGLEAWGLKIAEYRPPSVQLCESLTTASDKANASNENALAAMLREVAQKEEAASKKFREAFEVEVEGGKNGLSSFSKEAEALRARAKELWSDVTTLRNRREEIIGNRLLLADTLRKTCAGAS